MQLQYRLYIQIMYLIRYLYWIGRHRDHYGLGMTKSFHFWRRLRFSHFRSHWPLGLPLSFWPIDPQICLSSYCFPALCFRQIRRFYGFAAIGKIGGTWPTHKRRDGRTDGRTQRLTRPLGRPHNNANSLTKFKCTAKCLDFSYYLKYF